MIEEYDYVKMMNEVYEELVEIKSSSVMIHNMHTQMRLRYRRKRAEADLIFLREEKRRNDGMRWT